MLSVPAVNVVVRSCCHPERSEGSRESRPLHRIRPIFNQAFNRVFRPYLTSSTSTTKTVISTEAANALAGCAAEKSSSRPCPVVVCSCCHPERSEGSREFRPSIAFDPFSIRPSTGALRPLSDSTEAASAPERRSGEIRYSEATHFIVFTIAAIYFSPFSAQKTHVKPPNHLTHSNQIRSSWHFSYVQSAILNIDRKQSKPRPIAGANLLIISILCASPLMPIFCRHHHPANH